MTHHPPSDAPLDWALIDRYLAGQCDPDEVRQVLAYFDAVGSERRAALFAALKNRPVRERDIEALLARFHTRVASMEVPPGRRSDVRRWGLPALFAAALCGVVVVFFSTHITRARFHWPLTSARGMAKRYATGVGQRAVVTLADGSRVTLAPQTTLLVATDYGAATRSVALRGDAVFEVTPTTTVPFVVTTETATAQVLGTTFAVQAYAADPEVHVAVTAGKVAVSARVSGRIHSPTIVPAGGIVRVEDSSVVAVRGDASQYVAWTAGHLVFHDAPTPEVLAALTRWYGYQFRITDSTLAHQNLNVRLSTESLSAALATLKLALDAELTFDGTLVTVHPRRSASAVSPALRDRNTKVSPSTLEAGR